MEVEAGLAPFLVYKDCVSCFWVCTSGDVDRSGLKKLISVNFWWKSWILKYLAKILAKKNQNIQQYFLSSKMKSTVLFLTIFTFLSKIDENSGKNFGKCE